MNSTNIHDREGVIKIGACVTPCREYTVQKLGNKRLATFN